MTVYLVQGGAPPGREAAALPADHEQRLCGAHLVQGGAPPGREAAAGGDVDVDVGAAGDRAAGCEAAAGDGPGAAETPPRPQPGAAAAPGPPAGDRLYRNDLEVHADGTRTLRFIDVTRGSGLDGRSYDMGVAAGDFDNAGRVDLHRTGLGPNQLFRNAGGGHFTDVTREAGVGDPAGACRPRSSTSTAPAGSTCTSATISTRSATRRGPGRASNCAR